MQSEHAISKLNELRGIVDGETEELVDSLANIILLKQDLSNPMYGAKVTLHQKPEGEYVECSKEEHDNVEKWKRIAIAEDEGTTYKKLVPEDGQDITEYGTVTRRAIVFEGDVSDAPRGEYWDPNREEYTTPEDYPMGTVNVIVPNGENNTGYSDEPTTPKEFAQDYVYDVDVHTSVVPADGDPSWCQYTPGWD